MSTEPERLFNGRGLNFKWPFLTCFTEAISQLEQCESLLPCAVCGLTSGLECEKLMDFFDKQAVTKALKSSIASMQYGNEDFLADLVAEACSKWNGGVVVVVAVGWFGHVTG